MAFRLNDLLHFEENEIGNVKIRFCKMARQDEGGQDDTSPRRTAYEEFLTNPETVNNEWLLWRTTQNPFSEGEIAICFIPLDNGATDRWLITTIKRITAVRPEGQEPGIAYEAEELDRFKDLFGRVIVKYHKSMLSSYCYLNTIMDEIEVCEILPERYTESEFPGYDRVRLSYKQLSHILERGISNWIGALENQKAVYLITDKKTGKLYVGSATGDNGMLLQRWKNYVDNGTGGNVDFEKLKKEKGFDYIKENFQYSILEIFNGTTDSKKIVEREHWWMETLMTREFGYNNN